MKTLWALGGLVTAVVAMPASARDWSGEWAARTADRTFAIVSVARDRDGGWNVVLSRPKNSFIGESGAVGHLGHDVDRWYFHAPSTDADALALTPLGSSQGAKTLCRLSALRADRLIFTIGDVRTQLLLSPARPGESVSVDWNDDDANLVQPWPDNAEMSALFAEDQADRDVAPGHAIDWPAVHPRDAARRARTQALIDAGALNSGADFYHAAFVFQHGEAPADFLKAHALAIAAAARGYGMAAWIAAASLDRYLLNKGEPQVFGTQFQTPDDGPVTQEPYDRGMLTDGLRAVASVPSLAEQEKEREGYEARRNAIRAPNSAKGS
jgi:hypothetical protein